MTTIKPDHEQLENRIRELEQRAKALEKAEAQCREILNAAKDPFLIFDMRGVIREVNPAACRMYGYSRDEMIGLTGGDIVHPDYHHLFKTFVRKASEGRIFSAESVDIRKDGSTFDIEVRGSGVTYDGEPHLLAVVRDVSERKRVEQALRESEEKYRSLFENAVEGIFQTTLQGQYLSANPALARLFEYDSPQELIESVTNIGQQHYSDPKRREIFKKTLETKGHITNFEVQSVTKSGVTIWVSVNARAVKDETGSVRYLEGTIVDITERKRAEEALRKSEERYRLLWDVTLEGILVHRNGIVVDLNSSLERMFGYEKEELLHKNILKIGVHTDDIAIVRENIVKEYAEPYIIRCIKKNKEIFLAEIEARNFKMRDASLRVAAVRDVTFRKQAEDALREREEKLRSIFENKGTATGIFGEDGIIRECNAVFVEMSGYAKSDIIDKKKWSDFVVKEDLERLQGYHVQRAKAGGGAPLQYECRITNKNGEIREVIINISLVGEDRIVSLTDITDRKRTEERLRESESKFKSFSEQSLVGIYLIQDGVFQYVNPKFADIFGYEVTECENLPFRNLVFPEDLGKVKEQVRKRVDGEIESVRYGFRGVKKNGDVIHVEIYGSSAEYKGRAAAIGTMLDVTERKAAEAERERLQTQLNQAQKMESVGILAGGIAHNFNNILMGIQGRASLMMLARDTSDPDYAHLKCIEKYVRNAVELTRDLLGFARGGKYEVKPTDLNTLIRQENRMFGRTKREIQIHEAYEKDLWSVAVDQGQIRQVLLNLYVNASHAMPAGGDLFVRTQNVILNEKFTRAFDRVPGKYVKVSVADTGIGMDAATREKIFDPFFTTREAGQGSGLGLASVYGIIKNHEGFIDVRSEKGAGTTFDIYLPASEDKPREEAYRLQRQVLQQGRGTILLVDDQEIIIETGQEMLKRMGYGVRIARSGKEALSIYEENREAIDLVILDMIMPDMGGGETFDGLKAIDGKVKVLLASGYSIDGQATEILNRGCIGFIQKPFSVSDLSMKVKEAVEG